MDPSSPSSSPSPYVYFPHDTLQQKMHKLPPIELSYETTSPHKKVHEDYTIGMFIPKSKKYVAWFTFMGTEDVCILLELNRDKQVVSFQQIPVIFDTTEPHLAMGTLFYGSLVYEKDDRVFFVIEDLLIYQSISVRKLSFQHRLAIMKHILGSPHILPRPTARPPKGSTYLFVLPVMISPLNTQVEVAMKTVPYPIHHIQYRSMDKIIPYVNVMITLYSSFQSVRALSQPAPVFARKEARGVPAPFPPPPPRHEVLPPRRVDHVPSGKDRAVFLVKADIQSDIYYLYHPHYDSDFAYIPNYKTSVFMNSLFRHIKENVNLDAVEESDDEADLMDTRPDKYVDLSKELKMECLYHRKFRRWVPLRVVHGQ